MKTIEQKTIGPDQFNERLANVNRYWNNIEKRGEAKNQASEELKEKCRFIFVRDDGWSIASAAYYPALQLWPDDWEIIYTLRKPHQTLEGNSKRSKWTGTKRQFMDNMSDASGRVFSDADPGL